MRGALTKLAGVKTVDVKPGNKAFAVSYDPERVTTDAMLAALNDAKEPARLTGGG